jgi:CubicO group peptidase (beta-lactamase class C family)
MAYRFWLVSGLALGCLSACGSDAQEAPKNPDYAALFAQTLGELDAERVEQGIPGMSIAIVMDGKLAFSGGVGVRSLASGAPMTAKTLVLSSSVATKTLIAATLLDLEEEGKLDFTAPITDYAPYLSFESDPSAITLDALMTHRSGLREMTYRQDCTAANADLKSWFEETGQIPAVHAPGVAFMYSATGVVLGAAVIEALEQRPFTDVIRERWIDPDPASTATFDSVKAGAGELSSTHTPAASGTLVETSISAMQSRQCRDWQASVGLMASAEDHARLLERLLSKSGPLGPDSTARLEGELTSTGWGISYGYQTMSYQYKGVHVVAHGANWPGTHGWMTWVPERNFGVVILGNAEGWKAMRATDDFRFAILDRFLGLKGAAPDVTTPPSTWSKYVGRYSAPKAPINSFDIAQLPSGQLTCKRLTLDEVMPLTQGFADQAFTGGDSFEYRAPSGEQFATTFFPDQTGAMHYMLGSGPTGYFVAERVAEQ